MGLLLESTTSASAQRRNVACVATRFRPLKFRRVMGCARNPEWRKQCITLLYPLSSLGSCLVRTAPLLLILATAACGSDATDPPDPPNPGAAVFFTNEMKTDPAYLSWYDAQRS